MAGILLFNKPFRVLSQFTDEQETGKKRATLADYLSAPGYRAAGRLDYDSEGLLLLTDDGRLQHSITEPKAKVWKTYLVQVEGEVSDQALRQLCQGVSLKDGPTLPAQAIAIAPPDLWPRDPPVRFRQTVPDSWLQVRIREGRNRQVRRMTAAVGLPTLRLVRIAIGDWTLDTLQPGEFRADQVEIPHSKRARHSHRGKQR